MKPPSRRLWLWLAAAGVLLFLLVILLLDRFPGALADPSSQVDLVQRLLILVFVGGALMLRIRTRPGPALMAALAWIGIGLVLLLAYTFRDEAAAVGRRLIAELVPRDGSEQGGAMTYRAGTDGHFAVEAEVEGTRVEFLVDTGASRVVAGFSRQVQHLMFSRNASAGVLYPRHFLGVELTAHVISSISRAV